MNLSGFWFLFCRLFVYLQVLVASDISFLISAAVVFREPCRLRWLGGGRLPSMECILRQASLALCLRLGVSRIASAIVCSDGGCILLTETAHQTFCFQTSGVEPQ